MQRGARFVLLRSVPMQRGARFLILGIPWVVQHGLRQGFRNIYKTNAFCTVLGLEGLLISSDGFKHDDANVKNRCKNCYFCNFLGAPHGVHAWTMKMRKAFPCSVALVQFCAEALPCSMALVFGFWACHLMVEHGPSEGA